MILRNRLNFAFVSLQFRQHYLPLVDVMMLAIRLSYSARIYLLVCGERVSNNISIFPSIRPLRSQDANRLVVRSLQLGSKEMLMSANEMNHGGYMKDSSIPWPEERTSES